MAPMIGGHSLFALIAWWLSATLMAPRQYCCNKLHFDRCFPPSILNLYLKQNLVASTVSRKSYFDLERSWYHWRVYMTSNSSNTPIGHRYHVGSRGNRIQLLADMLCVVYHDMVWIWALYFKGWRSNWHFTIQADFTALFSCASPILRDTIARGGLKQCQRE